MILAQLVGLVFFALLVDRVTRIGAVMDSTQNAKKNAVVRRRRRRRRRRSLSLQSLCWPGQRLC